MDTQKRLPLQLMECYQHFSDTVNRINLGATDNFGDESIKYGATTQENPDGSRSSYVQDLNNKYPFDPRKPEGPDNKPVGRVGWWNAEERRYQHGAGFSDSFDEFVEANRKGAHEAAKAILADPRRDEALGYW